MLLGSFHFQARSSASFRGIFGANSDKYHDPVGPRALIVWLISSMEKFSGARRVIDAVCDGKPTCVNGEFSASFVRLTSADALTCWVTHTTGCHRRSKNNTFIF